MIIKTVLPAEHIGLIQVFIDANELVGVEIVLADYVTKKCIRKVLHLKCSNEDTSMKLSYMALVHCGISNMLDDFLLKCKVPVLDLRPETINTEYAT